MLATDDTFATFEDVKREAKFLKAVDTFRTPGKRKRDLDVMDPSMDALGRIQPAKYERVFPAEEEELEKVVQYGMKKGILTGVVSNLETNVISLNEGIAEVASLASGRFQANEETLDLLSGVINNVRVGVGSPVEVASLFMAPTMWGSVSLMSDEILRLGSSLQDLLNVALPFHVDTGSHIKGCNNQLVASK